MKKAIITVALAAMICSAGAANANSWAFEANGAKAHDINGFEAGVGYNFENERFRLTPIIGGFFYQGENDRYYVDEFSNGQSRCRDSETGRFAKSELCNNGEAMAYGKLEAALKLNKTWEVGAGYRADKIDNASYGLVSAKFGEYTAIQLFGGKDYYGLGFRVNY